MPYATTGHYYTNEVTRTNFRILKVGGTEDNSEVIVLDTTPKKWAKSARILRTTRGKIERNPYITEDFINPAKNGLDKIFVKLGGDEFAIMRYPCKERIIGSLYAEEPWNVKQITLAYSRKRDLFLRNINAQNLIIDNCSYDSLWLENCNFNNVIINKCGFYSPILINCTFNNATVKNSKWQTTATLSKTTIKKYNIASSMGKIVKYTDSLFTDGKGFICDGKFMLTAPAVNI